jgi:hypothetical protein
MESGVSSPDTQTNRSEFRGLILHERDQMRDHQRRSAARDGGQLIAERLPCPGRHHKQQIAPGSGRAANLFLIGAETGKAKYGLEQPAEYVRIGEIGQDESGGPAAKAFSFMVYFRRVPTTAAFHNTRAIF